MLKLVAILLAVAVLAWLVLGAGNSIPADPVTASAALGLEIKAQAEIAARVPGLSNRIRLAQASGDGDATARLALLKDLKRLHQDFAVVRQQLTTMGESEADIDRWLERIDWAGFLALQRTYLAPAGD